MKKIKLYLGVVLSIASFGFFASCQTDPIDNGISEMTPLDASFTVTPVSGSNNRFVLTAKTTNYLFSKWNSGDGSPDFSGKQSETIFLPDAGTYKVSHIAVGKGGEQFVSVQNITVTVSDPLAGNIITGGKFANATDHAKWIPYDVAFWSSNATLAFGDGFAQINSNGWDQYGLYQAINVIKDQKYNIDMIVSSTSGHSNTWFEVYVGEGKPVDDVEYKEGGMKRTVNTWDGCGLAPYAGKISIVGCNANNNKGIYTATKTGTVYFVIRAGGENMKDGIKISNIEMRGTN
jgi:hypothetical protein